MTDGKITGMHHFDSKAKVEDYIREHIMSKGVKAAFFVPSMYMQLFQTMFKPQPVNLSIHHCDVLISYVQALPYVTCNTD